MLPVLKIEPEILHSLRASNRLVLTAPTGSGKTTQVPQILHRSPLIPAQIIVLQPRRLATRMVARRVAHELNCDPGSTVGYQTRHESQISRDTRIRFITEGLLLRLLHADPKLTATSAVILDEFHERNIAADLSLGLLRVLQETHRPDLKLIVMSATLDAQAVATYLNCPTLSAPGRLHPVNIHYLPRRSTAPPWDLAAEALATALERESEGHILIFMPGVYEINRTLDACRRAASSPDLRFLPLHGSLPTHQQDAAVAPSTHRKVIVATNVAETSITIDNVRIVIDSGLARIHRFDSARGLNVLRVQPISRASADQRSGRAGRTAPGLCLRLWTEQDHHQARESHEPPEALRIELSESLLQLHAMGTNPRDFPWLDRPTHDSLDRAESVLHMLGAIDSGCHRSAGCHGSAAPSQPVQDPQPPAHLTPTGRQMSNFPLPPRLSRMLLEAARRNCLQRAVIWAALIGERDIILRANAKELSRFEDPAEPPSDLAVRERALEAAAAASFDPARCDSLALHANTCRQVNQVAQQLLSICKKMGLLSHSPPHRGEVKGWSSASGPRVPPENSGPRVPPLIPPKAETSDQTPALIRSLLTAFPDHLALRPDPHRPHCLMPGRKKVVLDPFSVVARAAVARASRPCSSPSLLLAVEINEIGRGDDVHTTLSLASHIEPDWLDPARLTTRTTTLWNDKTLAAESVEEQLYDPTWVPQVGLGVPRVECLSQPVLTSQAQHGLAQGGQPDAPESSPDLFLVISRTARPDADPQAAADMLVERILSGGLKLESWDDTVTQWLNRVRCVADWFPERSLLRYDPDDLRVILHEFIADATRFTQIRDRPCLDPLRNALSWDDQQFVERHAPAALPLPSGYRMKLTYNPGSIPRGRAKIQDFYGLTETPRIAAGRQPILLEILAPNLRPIQVTQDLANFWKTLYPQIKNDLRRRYPRHEWK